MSNFYPFLPGILFLASFFCVGCDQTSYESASGNSPPRSPSQSRTLDLGFSPITSSGLLATAICEDRKFITELEELGWSLICTPVFSGAEIRAGIEEGWLDMGTIDEQVANSACSSGVIRIIAIADQSYKSIISSHPSMVDEIRKMTVGAPNGFIGINSFQKQMTDWGLDISSTKFRTTPLMELPHLLRRGKVDAIVSWEPLSSLVMADFPEWHYLLRNIGRTYWAIHPLLEQDTLVTLSMLRSHTRQLRLLREYDYRHRIETRRWEYASTLGFPIQSPKSIQKLAEKPTPLSFCPSSYFAQPNILLPSSCIESNALNSALHQYMQEQLQ